MFLPTLSRHFASMKNEAKNISLSGGGSDSALDIIISWSGFDSPYDVKLCVGPASGKVTGGYTSRCTTRNLK